MRRVLVGMGNPLGLDDAVGVHVARDLAPPGWTCLAVGTALENVIGELVRLTPDLLVVVDAAEMDLEPGAFRRLPLPEAETMCGSTHGLPLSFLMPMLSSSSGELVLIGIQPGTLSTGEGLSANVAAGARRLAELLVAGNLEGIPSIA